MTAPIVHETTRLRTHVDTGGQERPQSGALIAVVSRIYETQGHSLRADLWERIAEGKKR
jgi:hypothetical protein